MRVELKRDNVGWVISLRIRPDAFHKPVESSFLAALARFMEGDDNPDQLRTAAALYRTQAALLSTEEPNDER